MWSTIHIYAVADWRSLWLSPFSFWCNNFNRFWRCFSCFPNIKNHNSKLEMCKIFLTLKFGSFTQIKDVWNIKTPWTRINFTSWRMKSAKTPFSIISAILWGLWCFFWFICIFQYLWKLFVGVSDKKQLWPVPLIELFKIDPFQ